MHFDVNFGNWLPDDPEIKLIGKCENCGEYIYDTYDRFEVDGMLFCSKCCLFQFLGIKEVTC